MGANRLLAGGSFGDNRSYRDVVKQNLVWVELPPTGGEIKRKVVDMFQSGRYRGAIVEIEGVSGEESGRG